MSKVWTTSFSWSIQDARFLPGNPKQKRWEWMGRNGRRLVLKNIDNINWLVVWNMNFMTFHIYIYIYIYWECHHPNWRTHMFQRGRSTNQIRLAADTTSSVGWHSHVTQVLKIAYVGTNYHGNAWQDRDWTLVKPWQSELYTFWTPSLIIMFPTYISAYIHTHIYIYIHQSFINL